MQQRAERHGARGVGQGPHRGLQPGGVRSQVRPVSSSASRLWQNVGVCVARRRSRGRRILSNAVCDRDARVPVAGRGRVYLCCGAGVLGIFVSTTTRSPEHATSSRPAAVRWIESPVDGPEALRPRRRTRERTHTLRAMAYQTLDLGFRREAPQIAQASVHGERYAAATPRDRALLGVVPADDLRSPRPRGIRRMPKVTGCDSGACASMPE